MSSSVIGIPANKRKLVKSPNATEVCTFRTVALRCVPPRANHEHASHIQPREVAIHPFSDHPHSFSLNMANEGLPNDALSVLGRFSTGFGTGGTSFAPEHRREVIHRSPVPASVGMSSLEHAKIALPSMHVITFPRSAGRFFLPRTKSTSFA